MKSRVWHSVWNVEVRSVKRGVWSWERNLLPFYFNEEPYSKPTNMEWGATFSDQLTLGPQTCPSPWIGQHHIGAPTSDDPQWHGPQLFMRTVLLMPGTYGKMWLIASDDPNMIHHPWGGNHQWSVAVECWVLFEIRCRETIAHLEDRRVQLLGQNGFAVDPLDVAVNPRFCFFPEEYVFVIYIYTYLFLGMYIAVLHESCISVWDQQKKLCDPNALLQNRLVSIVFAIYQTKKSASTQCRVQLFYALEYPILWCFFFFPSTPLHSDSCNGMTAVGKRERERARQEGLSKWSQLMLHALVRINLYLVMTNTMPNISLWQRLYPAGFNICNICPCHFCFALGVSSFQHDTCDVPLFTHSRSIVRL